ncbi:hypothetical protein P4O66_001620 [Electrophorus voltai]|uniref:Uncharacterized protein n=1 Tax=Electrophorus voltai TaxID=2609070 RepID=A0AAD9DU67_9TELE|nr:hypothetical protein P4O66_001620 [Electrophorus voltai]
MSKSSLNSTVPIREVIYVVLHEFKDLLKVCSCGSKLDLLPDPLRLNAAALSPDPPALVPGVEEATPQVPMPCARLFPVSYARPVPVVAPQSSPVPQKAATALLPVFYVSTDLPPVSQSCVGGIVVFVHPSVAQFRGGYYHGVFRALGYPTGCQLVRNHVLH